jgi:hypothetical protein
VAFEPLFLTRAHDFLDLVHFKNLSFFVSDFKILGTGWTVIEL